MKRPIPIISCFKSICFQYLHWYTYGNASFGEAISILWFQLSCCAAVVFDALLNQNLATKLAVDPKANIGIVSYQVRVANVGSRLLNQGHVRVLG